VAYEKLTGPSGLATPRGVREERKGDKDLWLPSLTDLRGGLAGGECRDRRRAARLRSSIGKGQDKTEEQGLKHVLRQAPAAEPGAAEGFRKTPREALPKAGGGSKKEEGRMDGIH